MGTFYVLRFSVSVNAYAHALCSCSSLFKNETSTETSTSSFHFTFFCFFFSSFIHFLISTTRRFYVFRSSTFKNETNSCQFQFIRVINTPSITSTSQRHLYFLQSRIPSFYESTKKKINKKNKNDRHLAH